MENTPPNLAIIIIGIFLATCLLVGHMLWKSGVLAKWLHRKMMSGKTPAGTVIDDYQALVAVNSLIDSLNLEGIKAPGISIRVFLKYQSAFSSVEINDEFNFCFLLYNYRSTQRVDCCLYKKSETKYQNKCYFSQSVDCSIDLISDQAITNEIDQITNFSGVYLAGSEKSLLLWQSSNPMSDVARLIQIL